MALAPDPSRVWMLVKDEYMRSVTEDAVKVLSKAKTTRGLVVGIFHAWGGAAGPFPAGPARLDTKSALVHLPTARAGALKMNLLLGKVLRNMTTARALCKETKSTFRFKGTLNLQIAMRSILRCPEWNFVRSLPLAIPRAVLDQPEASALCRRRKRVLARLKYNEDGRSLSPLIRARLLKRGAWDNASFWLNSVSYKDERFEPTWTSWRTSLMHNNFSGLRSVAKRGRPHEGEMCPHSVPTPPAHEDAKDLSFSGMPLQDLRLFIGWTTQIRAINKSLFREIQPEFRILKKFLALLFDVRAAPQRVLIDMENLLKCCIRNGVPCSWPASIQPMRAGLPVPGPHMCFSCMLDPQEHEFCPMIGVRHSSAAPPPPSMPRYCEPALPGVEESNDYISLTYSDVDARYDCCFG